MFLTLLMGGQHGTRARWIGTAAFVSAHAAFIVVAGAWAWLGYPLRIALALAVPLAIVISARRSVWNRPPGEPRTLRGRFDTGLRMALAVVFTLLLAGALAGYRTSEPAIELEFPLRNGVYVVGQGGSTVLVNYHATYPPQKYALDISKLNRFGSRAAGLYPADLEAYAIFGEEVYAPCDGQVVAVSDGDADRSPPDSDPSNPPGNHVAIACGEVTVYLAHLQRGSVRVKEAEAIAAGQPIGRVGNSGNTSEPHLHIHAARVRNRPRPEVLTKENLRDLLDRQEGVPIRFNGRFLVRNSLVWR